MLKKIPEYTSWHWKKDGEPTGSWCLGPPLVDSLCEGFFLVHHPEQTLELEEITVVEGSQKAGEVLLPVDMTKYVAKGTKLSLKQRLLGRV